MKKKIYVIANANEFMLIMICLYTKEVSIDKILFKENKRELFRKKFGLVNEKQYTTNYPT